MCEPCIIEIYTGLTLNYSLKDNDDYRNYYYRVLEMLLNLKWGKKGPVSSSELQDLLKSIGRSESGITEYKIPLEIISEILNEMYYYTILEKTHLGCQEAKYEISI